MVDAEGASKVSKRWRVVLAGHQGVLVPGEHVGGTIFL